MKTKKRNIIWNLPRLLKNSWVLFNNPQIPLTRKLITIFLASFYFIWPLDLIPDVPLVGQLDDIAVIFFLLNWFVNKSQFRHKNKITTSDDNYIEADYYYPEEDDK